MSGVQSKSRSTLASDNARLRTERDRAQRDLEKARAETARLTELVNRLDLTPRSRATLANVTEALRLAEYHSDPVSSNPITGVTARSAERSHEGASTEYARVTHKVLCDELDWDAAQAITALQQGRSLRRRGNKKTAVPMLECYTPRCKGEKRRLTPAWLDLPAGGVVVLNVCPYCERPWSNSQRAKAAPEMPGRVDEATLRRWLGMPQDELPLKEERGQ